MLGMDEAWDRTQELSKDEPAEQPWLTADVESESKVQLSAADKLRLDQIFSGESGGRQLDLDALKTEQKNNAYRWDTDDEIDGYVYWVIKLYKARRADNEDFWLKNVEGHLRPGEVCCILSPDSASTRFINLLSGRCPPGDFYGEIRVGGVAKTAPLMKSGTSYLLDSQVLADFVTVQESLMYTTYFVQPQSKRIEQRMEMVEKLMELLGIEKLRDLRITGLCGRGISNAERVLVNLGNMLLDGKRIVFLDCPTKDLDLMETEAITVKIQFLAKVERLTVFMSMENPTKSMFDNFTKLLILANGQQLYFGTTQKVADFLQRIGFPLPEQTSIYDHVLQIIHDGGDMDSEDHLSFRESRAVEQEMDADKSKDTVRQERNENLQRILALAKLAYEQSQKVGMSPEEIKDFIREVGRMRLRNDFLQMQGFQLTSYVTGWFFQIRTLVERKLKKTYRDPSALVVQIVPLGIWVGIISWWFHNVGEKSHVYQLDDYAGLQSLIDARQVMDVKSYDKLVAIFISLFGVQFLSLNCVSDAIKEGKLYTSEARSFLYCKSAFVVSWVVICLLEQCILIIPYTFCTFYFFHLYSSREIFLEDDSGDVPFYFYYLMVHVLIAVISELQINILAFATQQTNATLQAAVAIQVVTTLFAGIVVPFPDTQPIFQGIGYISPLKFAFEGIILEYEHEAKFDDTKSIASILGTENHPFLEDRYMAWIVLGSYLIILFMIFIAAASLRTYTSTKTKTK